MFRRKAEEIRPAGVEGGPGPKPLKTAFEVAEKICSILERIEGHLSAKGKPVMHDIDPGIHDKRFIGPIHRSENKDLPLTHQSKTVTSEHDQMKAGIADYCNKQCLERRCQFLQPMTCCLSKCKPAQLEPRYNQCVVQAASVEGLPITTTNADIPPDQIVLTGNGESK